MHFVCLFVCLVMLYTATFPVISNLFLLPRGLCCMSCRVTRPLILIGWLWWAGLMVDSWPVIWLVSIQSSTEHVQHGTPSSTQPLFLGPVTSLTGKHFYLQFYFVSTRLQALDDVNTVLVVNKLLCMFCCPLQEIFLCWSGIQLWPAAHSTSPDHHAGEITYSACSTGTNTFTRLLNY